MRASGVLLVDKPYGYSSARVVGALKCAHRLDKVGHAGTLDPAATGLLVVLAGSATRLAALAESGTKKYSGQFLFGVTTDTDDITGRVVARSSSLPAFADLCALVPRFTGAISQSPPAISAVKINGRRAYRLSRAGVSVETKLRSVEIAQLEFFDPAYRRRIGCSEGVESVRFVMTCSKGTYVRSLARDIGELLGSGGCVLSLRREESAPFSMAEGVSFEEALATNCFLPWSCMVNRPGGVSIPNFECSQEEIDSIGHGSMSERVRSGFNAASGRELATACDIAPKYVLYSCGAISAHPVGMCVARNGDWRRVFHDVP